MRWPATADSLSGPGPAGVSRSARCHRRLDRHHRNRHEGQRGAGTEPRYRLLALESAEPAARSHELDTHSVYNANGTEMRESWGPLHEVGLEASGELVQARSHTTTRYGEDEPMPPAGTPPAYLPTKETVAAVVPGKEGGFEPRVTETRYDRSHRPLKYARPMQWGVGRAIIIGAALFAFVPGSASAHTSAPFVSFGHGKRKIAIFTKAQCLHGVRCKSRVRHCNRWARNQISCQSEILFWEEDNAVTYCHWQSLAWRIRRSKPLEVWSEPKPVCQPMQDGPHWPARRSPQHS